MRSYLEIALEAIEPEQLSGAQCWAPNLPNPPLNIFGQSPAKPSLQNPSACTSNVCPGGFGIETEVRLAPHKCSKDYREWLQNWDCLGKTQ